MLLSDAIDEFLVARRSGGYRKNTVRNDEHNLRQFLLSAGNIQVKNVNTRHVDSFMGDGASRGLSPSTMNLRLATLRAFFKHCTMRRYIAAANDPMVGRRKYREPNRRRLQVPVFDFNRLLDSARDPRDRIVIALGLYLLLRESEIRALSVGDVNLADGTVHVVVPKSSKTDNMPVSVELDAELRTWLTFYSMHVDRPLSPTDALVPAWVQGQIRQEDGGQYRVQKSERFNPARHYSTPHRAVQKALIACGYATHDDSGKSLQEGVHTLRRSAARARFDALAEMSVDAALRHVQSLLHHSSVATTERYLGLDSDVVARDRLIRGEAMFPAAVSEAGLRRVGA